MSQKQTALYLSIALLSASVIGYQLALMQILSIQQWHYMAFMVISIALLAFGVSGTLLAIFKKRLTESFDKVYPLLLLSTTWCMIICPLMTGSPGLQFDTYLLFSEVTHIIRFLFTCLLYFLPILLAATAIGLSFTYYSNQIAHLYFANLIGSGIGGALTVALMWAAMPQHLPASISILPLMGAILFSLKKADNKQAWIYGFSILLITGTLIFAPGIQPSQYKSLSKTINLPDAKITFEQNSPFGLIQQVSSSAIRYAPSLSLINTNPIPHAHLVFVNGEAAGYLPTDTIEETPHVLNSSPQALPYKLRQRNNCLLLRSGTGELVPLALTNRCKTVNCLEPNPLLQKVANSYYSKNTETRFITGSIRSFFKTDNTLYDVICYTPVGSFYGTNGLYALEEQHWLTTEAFTEAWEHLSDNGVLSISCWLDYPYRTPYKLMATIDDLLKLKKKDSHAHVFIVQNWNQLTFLIKRSSFHMAELTMAQQFCDSLLFDFIPLHNDTGTTKAMIHQSNDSVFLDNLRFLASPHKDKLYSSYAFKIDPASSDKPYFSHFLKLKSLWKLSKSNQLSSLPYFELGYFFALYTLLLVTFLGLILIVLPLKLMGNIKVKSNIFLYYANIGLGYMITEMLFIHQYNSYFETPTYSIAIVLSILLISSGIGSYYSKNIFFAKKLWLAPLTVAILLVLSKFLTPPLIAVTVSFPFIGKITLCTLTLGSIGFFMGIPFPSAMLKLSRHSIHSIPAAWGINGLFSVIATPFAVILSAELGFSTLIFCGAICYFVAGLVTSKKFP